MKPTRTSSWVYPWTIFASRQTFYDVNEGLRMSPSKRGTKFADVQTKWSSFVQLSETTLVLNSVHVNVCTQRLPFCSLEELQQLSIEQDVLLFLFFLQKSVPFYWQNWNRGWTVVTSFVVMSHWETFSTRISHLCAATCTALQNILDTRFVMKR